MLVPAFLAAFFMDLSVVSTVMEPKREKHDVRE